MFYLLNQEVRSHENLSGTRLSVFLTLINFNRILHHFAVHALVYEPTTGEAKMLPVDFGSYLRELRSVYDLYRVEDDITS